jgi:flavodoxin I
MGKLSRKVRQRGAKLVGAWPTEGYEFNRSEAVQGYNFVGLAIDEDNQNDRTVDRVELWVEILRLSFDGPPAHA